MLQGAWGDAEAGRTLLPPREGIAGPKGAMMDGTEQGALHASLQVDYATGLVVPPGRAAWDPPLGVPGCHVGADDRIGSPPNPGKQQIILSHR